MLEFQEALRAAITTWRVDLPFYKDYRSPPVDVMRGLRLNGLSLILMTHAGMGKDLVVSVDLGSLEPYDEPCGHRVVLQSPEHIEAIPVYAASAVPGGAPTRHYDASGLSVTKLMDGLGYSLIRGQQSGVQGKLITIAAGMDRDDALAEGLRIVCHLEWNRANMAGYVGAELLFVMIAGELGVNTTQLSPSPPLLEEIQKIDPKLGVQQCLEATTVAGALLAKAFGPDAEFAFFQHQAALYDSSNAENTFEIRGLK